MNTFVWGPPTWKLLHSMSFADPGALRDAVEGVVQFMDSLGEVLPCIYCRESYARFVGDMPSVRSAIQTGTLARWMYTLHARVNSKLGAQTPPWERVVKRYTFRRVQWCPQDVWDMVGLVGVNHAPGKHAAYVAWWGALGVVVRLAGGSPRMVSIMDAVTCPGCPQDFVVAATVMSSKHGDTAAPCVPSVRHAEQRYMGCKASVT
jgi:hypothetical protein